MRFQVLALAAALLSMTAAAAQASPATVLPDSAHAIGRGATQIFKGTVHGVGHQVDNAGYAARKTGHSVVRGVHHVTHRHHRHHHYYHSRHTHSHVVVHHHS